MPHHGLSVVEFLVIMSVCPAGKEDTIEGEATNGWNRAFLCTSCPTRWWHPVPHTRAPPLPKQLPVRSPGFHCHQGRRLTRPLLYHRAPHPTSVLSSRVEAKTGACKNNDGGSHDVSRSGGCRHRRRRHKLRQTQQHRGPGDREFGAKRQRHRDLGAGRGARRRTRSAAREAARRGGARDVPRVHRGQQEWRVRNGSGRELLCTFSSLRWWLCMPFQRWWCVWTMKSISGNSRTRHERHRLCTNKQSIVVNGTACRRKLLALLISSARGSR